MKRDNFIPPRDGGSRPGRKSGDESAFGMLPHRGAPDGTTGVNPWGSIIFCLICIFLITLSRFVPAQYRNLKQNLAIIDFENKTAFSDVGTGVQDILTTVLWKSDRFILVEREKIRKILDEQDFSHSGRVPAEAAIEIGRILGADYILTGGITEAGYVYPAPMSHRGGAKEEGKIISRIVLDARLIDVTTTQVVLAETAFGNVPGTDINTAIRQAVEGLVLKITEAVDKKPWQSQVIKADGQSVYINAGQEHGIQKGDRFNVYKKGEELIDPKTKAVVGYLSKKIGEIEIIDVQGKYSIGTVIEGVGFEKGNFVKKE